MKKLENTTKTTAIYSDDNKHRYVLSKEWDDMGKKAMILMLYPCAMDITQLDLTTMLCCNNSVKLDFSGIHILNLYSKINANVSHDVAEINMADNNTQIVEYAKKADVSTIIIAWGHGNNSKKVNVRQKEVLKLLLPYQDKIMTLEDERSVLGLHPLSPSLRSMWRLAKFEMPDLKDEPIKDEADNKKKRKKADKQALTIKEEETQDTESDTESKEETE